MQGTVSTALRRAFYVPDVFCAELEKLPLRHTNCLYNPDVSWGLTDLGVEVTLDSQSPSGLLLTPEHPQMYSQSGCCLPVSCVLYPDVGPDANAPGVPLWNLLM